MLALDIACSDFEDDFTELQAQICGAWNDLVHSTLVEGILDPALSEYEVSLEDALAVAHSPIQTLIFDRAPDVQLAGGVTVSVALEGEVKIGPSLGAASAGVEALSLSTGYNFTFGVNNFDWKLSRAFEVGLGPGKLAGEYFATFDSILDGADNEEITFGMSLGVAAAASTRGAALQGFQFGPNFAVGRDITLTVQTKLQQQDFLENFVEQGTLAEGLADLFVPYAGDTWWENVISATTQTSQFSPVFGLAEWLDIDLLTRTDTPFGLLAKAAENDSPDYERGLSAIVQDNIGLKAGVWAGLGGSLPLVLGEPSAGVRAGTAISAGITETVYGPESIDWFQGTRPLNYLQVREKLDSVTPTGVTVITHGFEARPDAGESLLPLAKVIQERNGGWLLDYDVPSPASNGYFDTTAGQSIFPMSEQSGEAGELILLFDWHQGGREFSAGWAEAGGDAMFSLLVGLDLIDPASPNENPPLHFIGHGAGAAVTSEAIERLARFDVPVEQVTYLDPHDFVQLDAEGNPFERDVAQRLHELGSPQLNGNEVLNYGATVWSNVRFADVYYQTRGGTQGRPIPGAYNVWINGRIPAGSGNPHTYVWETFYTNTVLGSAEEPIGYAFSRAASGSRNRPAPLFFNEDLNNNGTLDSEDVNGNGELDSGEDIDRDGILDSEDLNRNGELDDAPQDHVHTQAALLTVDSEERQQITTARFEPVWGATTLDIIANGGFESGEVGLFRNIAPGWSHYRGGGPGVIRRAEGDNHVLSLRDGQVNRTHSLLYVPPVEDLVLTFHAQRRSLVIENDDRLIVQLGEETVLAVPLDVRDSGFRTFRAFVPPRVLNTAQPLTFSIESTGLDTQGAVWIDNVSFINPATGGTGDVIEATPAFLHAEPSQFDLLGAAQLFVNEETSEVVTDTLLNRSLTQHGDRTFYELSRPAEGGVAEQRLGKLYLPQGEPQDSFASSGRFFFVPATTGIVTDALLERDGFQGLLDVFVGNYIEAPAAPAANLAQAETLTLNGTEIVLSGGMTPADVQDAINQRSSETGVLADRAGTGGAIRLFTLGLNPREVTITSTVSATADSSGIGTGHLTGVLQSNRIIVNTLDGYSGAGANQVTSQGQRAL